MFELNFDKVLLVHIEVIGLKVVSKKLGPLFLNIVLFFEHVFEEDILVKTLFVEPFIKLD